MVGWLTLGAGCLPSGVRELETAAPGGSGTGSVPSHTGTATPTETAPPAALVGVEACDGVRFLATFDGHVLAVEVALDAWSAAVAGTPTTGTWDLATDDLLIVGGLEGDFGSGEVCSSIEEWPWDAAWSGGSGWLTITFAPSAAWPAEDDAWSYDGTILGDVEVTFEDAVVWPVGSGDTISIGDQTAVLPFHTPSLPA